MRIIKEHLYSNINYRIVFLKTKGVIKVCTMNNESNFAPRKGLNRFDGEDDPLMLWRSKGKAIQPVGH